MRLFLRLFASVSLAVLSLATANAETALPPCPANRAPPLALSRLREAVELDHEVTIVALGSSSTVGRRSSDVGHSYPAVLQAELSAALPMAHIAVLNRGIDGQDVAEMLPRIDRDALALHPALVIWQVGANGAMQRTDPVLFKRLVGNGVQRLQDANVDVVLMDNQRAPAILASPDNVPIDQALADVAKTYGVGLFGRDALMEQWQFSGFPYAQFVSDDGIHHNDRGYRCMAKALAAAIVEGLGQPAAEPVRSALLQR